MATTPRTPTLERAPSSSSSSAPASSNSRKVILSAIVLCVICLQGLRMYFHHMHHHHHSSHELEWLYHPSHVHHHQYANKNQTEFAGCPKCAECAACPKCPEQVHCPRVPQSATEWDEVLRAEQEKVAALEEQLRVANDKIAKFELRVKNVKSNIKVEQKSTSECMAAAAGERLKYSERLYVLMTRALKNKIAAVRLKRRVDAAGNVPELPESNKTRIDIAPAPSPPPFSMPPMSRDKMYEVVNETISEMSIRRLTEALQELQAQGSEVEDWMIEELQQMPAIGADEILEDDAAREQWIESIRDSSTDLLDGAPMRLGDPKVRERLIARTPDAERVFPDLFGNSTDTNAALKEKWAKQDVARTRGRSRRGNSFTTPSHLSVSRKVPNSAAKFDRCAIVGNSQRLLLQKFGDVIDGHDVVMRLNNAPTLGYEPYVGSKTTHRLTNNQWTRQYSAGARLPLEWNVTIMSSRTDQNQYTKLFTALKQTRGDIAVVRLTLEAVKRGGNLLRTVQSRLEKWRGVEYLGKGSPSSGFIGVFLLLQLCTELSVFGVGLEGCAGMCPGSSAWHYWQEETFATSREFGEDPHHSFELEHDVLRILEADGIVKMWISKRKESLQEEGRLLKKKQPVLIKAAQGVTMKEKLTADMQCAKVTGAVCGCSRSCTDPTKDYRDAMIRRTKLERSSSQKADKDVDKAWPKEQEEKDREAEAAKEAAKEAERNERDKILHSEAESMFKAAFEADEAVEMDWRDEDMGGDEFDEDNVRLVSGERTHSESSEGKGRPRAAENRHPASHASTRKPTDNRQNSRGGQQRSRPKSL